ncbi:hypothetical protein [Neobacillus vireti]|nr:hypothetical protein [Neobacillus vireti]
MTGTLGGSQCPKGQEKTYDGHSGSDTGLQISGSGTDPDLWPKYNLILNCESHDNRDPRDEDADGFAAKLGVG